MSRALGSEDGDEEQIFGARSVVITIPGTILKDATGVPADYYEMSIPSWEDVRESEENGDQLNDGWNASWGTAPKTVEINGETVEFDPSKYTYFGWEVRSKINDNSRKYDFTMGDVLSSLLADGKTVPTGEDTAFPVGNTAEDGQRFAFTLVIPKLAGLILASGEKKGRKDRA